MAATFGIVWCWLLILIGTNSALEVSYFKADVSHLMCWAVLFWCLSCTFLTRFSFREQRRNEKGWDWNISCNCTYYPRQQEDTSLNLNWFDSGIISQQGASILRRSSFLTLVNGGAGNNSENFFVNLLGKSEKMKKKNCEHEDQSSHQS